MATVVLLTIVASGWFATVEGALPGWIRNVEGRSEIEAAFFRLMNLPGGDVPYRRPPRETRAALQELSKKRPADAELYALRAYEDEQQLDFTAAEANWKLALANSADKAAATLALADFYHRRMRPQEELQALASVATAPALPSEKLVPPRGQRSWRAFERMFDVIRAQGYGKDVAMAQYASWLARYPAEPSLYSQYLEYLLGQKEYAPAGQLIALYRKQFPADEIFPIRAEALLEYRKGSVAQGLAVYERNFQPLWAPELVQSYVGLLTETRSLRKFLDDARAALSANPENLAAAARVFYYYQQQGKLDAAAEVIARFRQQKEQRKSSWTAQELLTCARLLEAIHAYPESARYYYALYNSTGMEGAQETAVSGLADLLLTAPEMPMRFGAGDLSLYRDIATMDAGPGYLNGILSLILNTTYPANEFALQEQRAAPYFRRAEAARLLELLDSRFPNAPRRAELRAKLMDYYAAAGESEAVLREGKSFLSAFPHAPRRTDVALLMADAYARTGNAQGEFAIYDAILLEMADKADRIPLGSALAGAPQMVPQQREEEVQTEEPEDPANANRRRQTAAAFQLGASPQNETLGARSPEYARVLERYLGRLAQLKQIPRALGVLRKEIEHNPDDPGLYERFAIFLEQNQLGAEQEETYRRAIARFPDRSWHHKLARFYLRYRKQAEFEKLTREAVDTFKGTDLEAYFQDLVGQTNATMFLRLNLYASERFPHNPEFVRNLLRAYLSPGTRDAVAYEALLRRHWFEEADLRDTFFEYLSRTGKLTPEIQAVQAAVQPDGKTPWQLVAQQNPAAAQFLAEASLWRAHFEEAAPPLLGLTAEYPANAELGRTASSVFRSLAYYDPAQTSTAVKIEENLLKADPGSTEILARIGDIYADRSLFTAASPYWERIPRVAPGQTSGYREAATIYWDYFDFDRALQLLNEGRKKAGNESLFAYEAGAIFENKREYPRALQEYVNGALADGESSPAEVRLLDLSRRPRFRDLVERATQNLASTPAYSSAELNLRIRVLEAQNRKKEMGSFLEGVLTRATTTEQALEIENIAQQRSLELVRQRAVEKQAALASDPVTRLQLRYALARLYEQRKDLAGARRNYETLYKENPRILGVVRSMADFYWRTRQPAAAVAVLKQASREAYPELGRQFAFEAARKATEATLFEEARQILQPLLEAAPYDNQYVAAMAETYSASGNAQSLREFYEEKIKQFRSANMAPAETKAKLAMLRQGLIPALTRLSDFAGAVDQYIELINAFPEDENLASTAALYAQRHQRGPQLLGFYSKTMQQSPRDSRWAVVLARMQAAQEDYPAAIEAYGKAISLRPDRVDLRLARAALAERLMRFDDAVSDYDRVYQLSFKDSKWMEKIAEVRARQGRGEDCVAALKTAWIDGHPAKAGNFFVVAKRLEAWGMLQRAKEFAGQGVEIAGSELLAVPENHEGATLYMRVMSRLRLYAPAYATLQKALAAADATLPVLQAQVAREGIAAVTDREYRERMLQTRKANARQGMHAALSEAGNVAVQYYTPEEKAALAAFARTAWTSASREDQESFLMALAQSAGLAELEAAWRWEWLMQSPVDPTRALQDTATFAELQRRRLKFAELARQLEQFAPRLIPEQQHVPRLAAAQAYRDAGDGENELRVLSALSLGLFGEEQQQRFFELLLARRPQQLVSLAARWDGWGQAAANYIVAHGDFALSQAALKARAAGRPPVWQKSYAALLGLYFTESSANADFLAALGNQTIGERIGKALDRNDRLAGDVWFEYASRYGECLTVTRQGNAEDYLAARLEQSPASSNGYFELAEFYAEGNMLDAAVADYLHALELVPQSASIRERLALAYYRQGARAKAIAEWKRVFAALQRVLDRSPVPDHFWTDFALTADHLRTRKLFAELKPEMDGLLRTYLRRNGNYRSNAPLRSAFLAAGDPATAMAWILDLASAAPDPLLVISDISSASWIPEAQRGAILERILQSKRAAIEGTEGLDREYAIDNLRFWEIRWAAYLVQTKQFARAQEFLAGLPAETLSSRAASLVPLDLLAAAHLKMLDSRLELYKAEPQRAPSAEILRDAARQLLESGDRPSARKLLEFVFAREIAEHRLEASNFLGLAEIRLASGDLSGALELLRRLVLAVGETYPNLDASAALLEKTQHPAEAIEFIEPLAKATPWDRSFQLRLAKARIAAGLQADAAREVLARVAADSEAPYGLRVLAVQALPKGEPAGNFGSAELKLLFSGAAPVAPEAASQPYFYDARLLAARQSSNARTRIQLLEEALSDTPARSEARAPLLRAAASLRLDASVVAMLDFVLRDEMARQVDGQREEEDDFAEEVSLAETETADLDEETAPVYPVVKLTPLQQARLAVLAGDALVRLGRNQEALPYFQFAAKLEKSAARKREWNARIAATRASLRREQTNQVRQPILHEPLEQDRTVRPKLPMRAAAPVAPATKGGN